MNEFTGENQEIEVVETRVVKRITVGGIFTSILDAFNLERGGFFTIRSLLTNPGKTVKEYLGPNRYCLTPPFRILLITTAVALYFIGISDTPDDFAQGFKVSTDDGENEDLILLKLFGFFSDYGNILLWTFIPIAAFFSFLLNRKHKYNFAEHLVLQTYLFCIANLISLLLIVGQYTSKGAMFILITASMGFYYTYAYKVFTGRSILKSIWHTSLIMLLGTLIWYILLAVVLGIFFYFNKKLLT